MELEDSVSDVDDVSEGDDVFTISASAYLRMMYSLAKEAFLHPFSSYAEIDYETFEVKRY